MTDDQNRRMNGSIRSVLRGQNPEPDPPVDPPEPAAPPKPASPGAIGAGDGTQGGRARHRPSMNASIRALIKGETVE